MKKMIESGSLLVAALLFALSLLLPGYGAAEGQLHRNVRAEGACAVVGMTAERCQLLALQRARAAAIEEASGVQVTSSSLVTNSTLAADFIKTYARGFIVREEVEWLPLGQYQKDRSAAPIPEYRVRIVADVHTPQRQFLAAGLAAKLNRAVFTAGEKVRISVRVEKPVRLAIFNIQADDRAVLLFPNTYDGKNLISPGREWVYPAPDSAVELEVHPLPGHGRDAEAYFVAALPPGATVDFLARFAAGKPLPLSEFFRRFAEISAHSEEAILPYEVTAAGK
jgi:hypothetical protein